MNKAVLVTGASGFIGRHVVRVLADAGIPAVAFGRSVIPGPAGVSISSGDLLHAPDLERALDGVDRVIHLAAATGKASAEQMEAVNVDGTSALIEACGRLGVKRLVHVSTIAVGYEDITDYPYARSKRWAEQLVSESDLDWTIVRPTIVLGPDSPLLGPLKTLATPPVMLVPGAGTVMVQPIDVRDVATALVDMAMREASIGHVVELGGPERITMFNLLRLIREAAGKGPGPSLSIPLFLLKAGATAATGLLGPRTPLTTGQLTAFRYDSTADEPPAGVAPTAEHGIAAMLSAL